MNEWMFGKDHFCVSPTGDYKGNDDACYYGLPSIERSDPGASSSLPLYISLSRFDSVFGQVLTQLSVGFCGLLAMCLVSDSVQKARILERVCMGADGTADLLGPAELRPRASLIDLSPSS